MNLNRFNRRQFLIKTATAGTAATVIASLGQAAQRPASKPAGKPSGRSGGGMGGLKEFSKIRTSTPNAEKLGWRISVQQYTFRDRTFYEMLDVLVKQGVRNVEPAFFLPLSKDKPDLKSGDSLSAENRKEMKKRLDDLGIKMPTYYGPLEADKTKYRGVFDFAKEMGVETIVAEPPMDALEEIDKLCEEYKINLAIHNHPEGSGSAYWDPKVFAKAVEGKSPRIGGAPDTGHWVRTGLDTLESLKMYGKRILVVHLKDAEVSGKRDSRDVPLGTGKANYSAILQQMVDWKWKGVMTVEYEHLSPQLEQDVAACIKFVEDFASKVKV
ncbi:MAG: sugar phosphate isomerase/epimerase [Phycisphaerae bacterium]|nr:sugar phosphate isomerase/epimerase [Phycisphaerae bacterium]